MFARSLRSAVARPLSASTSTTSTASSRTTLLAASRRWNSTSSEDKKSAENVKDAADKVDSAAEEVAKKVQELEAQVKELKVSQPIRKSIVYRSSSNRAFSNFTTVRTYLRQSRFHQSSKTIRDGKDHRTRIRHPEIRPRPLTHRRHPLHRLEIRPATYPCREHRSYRLILRGSDDEGRIVEDVDEARGGRV